MRRTIAVGATLLLVGAGCVTSGKYEKKAKEAAANAASAQEAGAKAAACEAKVAELQKAVGSAQEQLTATAAARDELQAQAAALAEQKGALEAKSAQYEKLAGSLQRQIQAGQIELSELRGRMIVKLKDTILFPSGSARLSKEGGAALDVVAGVFKDMQGKNVLVAGYTDNVPVAGGPYKDNWELSSARAIAVVRYLASKGVPSAMLGAAGFGEFRPVVANDSPVNRSQNRRIEIALTPADYVPPVIEAR
jgi:chemotaxis protein MotB